MKLLFFTNSYPYGVGELWKTNELKVLVDYFEKIEIIPFSYAGNTEHVPFLNGIHYKQPLFPEGVKRFRWYSLAKYRFLFSKDIFVFISEFWNEKVFMSKKKLLKWTSASIKMYQIKKNPEFKKIIDGVDCNTVIYFYWGRETSEVLPLINLKSAKVISRLHRYDLYKDQNEGYIPYQYKQLKTLNRIFPCSDHGRSTLIKYYPDLKDRITVQRLGTISKGVAKQSKNGPFTIVSCSFVEKVKRVDVILKALKNLDADVHWVHIGDGTQLQSIVENSIKENLNHKITFLGRLKSQDVLEFYNDREIDLFINVSESEGVPVSIMEAFAASIPVFATDVGGTGEIVNNKNGKLLSKNIGPKDLAMEIEQYMQCSVTEKEDYRRHAFETYQQHCDAIKLAHEFAKSILIL